MVKAEVSGSASIVNGRREVPVQASQGRRHQPRQTIDLAKGGATAQWAMLVYLLSVVKQRGVRTETIRPIAKLVGWDMTVHDMSASISRWKKMEGEPVLRFAPGRRLIAIGTTGAPVPSKIVANYRPSTRTARRSKISKKYKSVVVSAP